MSNILWSIINLLILWFVGWPVAGFCAMIYIFVSPFGACIGGKCLNVVQCKSVTVSGCDKLNDILQKGVEWPRSLGRAIKNGDSNFGC